MNKKHKPIQVLHISTHHESCGIGKYQEAFLISMTDSREVQNEFYPTSLNKIKALVGDDLIKEMRTLREYVQNFDIVHIQHEFGLFRNRGEGLTDILDSVGTKPVIVTIHTAPSLLLANEKLHSLHPTRGVVDFMKRRISNKQMKQRMINPLKRVTKIITLNTQTKNQLMNIVNIPESAIYQRMIPIQEGMPNTKPPTLRKLMRTEDADIILCTVGFVHQFKGVDHAIRALTLLPSNYKLAILGGTHPDSGDPKVLESVRDLILTLNLEKRVYISGFIQEDARLSELIRGCNIALYPYSLEYYKLASSDAINRALMNHVPVIAYPTESFRELHLLSQGAIALTPEATYESLAQTIDALPVKKLLKKADAFVMQNSLKNAASDLISIYKEVYTLSH